VPSDKRQSAAAMTMQGAEQSADSIEVRERLGKLVGMLGSSHEGERSNAVDAIGSTLERSGLSWLWLSERLVDDGEQLRGHARLLADLIAERLRRGLLYAHEMTRTESKLVRDMLARCESGDPLPSETRLRKAIEIADRALALARPHG
jgi:hypothetical protein